MILMVMELSTTWEKKNMGMLVPIISACSDLSSNVTVAIFPLTTLSSARP